MVEIIPNWHPLLVHFTLGLLVTAVLFYWAGALLPKSSPWKQQWLNMANWSLWTGCLFAIATATAGWLAYNSVAHDTPSHAAMTLHRNWALPTAAFFLLLGLWAIILANKGRRPGFLFLTFSLTAAGVLMVTGWLGAEAVYRYGLGVKSLPAVAAGADGHNHSHNALHDVADAAEHNHTTTEMEQMMSQEDHDQHDHGSEAASAKNDLDKGATAKQQAKTMPAVTTDTLVSQAATDERHLHDANTISSSAESAGQNNNTTENNTPHSHHHAHSHNDESSAHHH